MCDHLLVTRFECGCHHGCPACKFNYRCDECHDFLVELTSTIYCEDCGWNGLEIDLSQKTYWDTSCPNCGSSNLKDI